MVLAVTGKEEEERLLRQHTLQEQEEEEDNDIGQDEFQVDDDAGVIMNPNLGENLTDIIMKEVMDDWTVKIPKNHKLTVHLYQSDI
uniref:Uncharacterized protein n=1 Tax=Peronospora matthiolae TaxID=2874970 RepID=A0AAV1UL38_9STRA